MLNYKKICALLLVSSVMSSPLFAESAAEEFARMKREMEASMNQAVADYDKYANDVQKEYLEYQKAVQEEYDEHCRKVKAMWGDDEVVESSPKTWVEYSDDQTQRSSVDFEKGTVTVEVLVPVDELEDQDLINSKMGDAVGDLISSQGKMLNYPSKIMEQGVVSDSPIVGGQIDYSGLGVTIPGEASTVQNTASQNTAAAPVAAAPAPRVATAPAPVIPTVSGSSAKLPKRSRRRVEQPKKTMAEQAAEDAAREAAVKAVAEKAAVAEAAAAKLIAAKEAEAKARDAKAAEVAKNSATVAAVKPTLASTSAPKPVSTTPAPKPVSTPAPVKSEVVVAASKPNPVIAAESVKVVAEQIVEKTPVKVNVKSDESGQKVAVVSVEMKLSTDHITTRAAKYSKLITKYSDRFEIPEPIIYAVIEQESSFNPLAKSGAPAYGLMQLVPASGGRDAYNYVFNKDHTPTPDYLYKAEQNIELGVGYIRKVMRIYLGKIKDYNSRLICAIAAYNTGIGNVSRAITGNTNLSKAIPVINTMTYEQVYAKLSRDLIENETKNYIKQVPERIKKYSQAK